MDEEEIYEEGDPRKYGVILPTDEDRMVWDHIFKMNILPTKFACDNIMTDLGIYDDILKLITRIGWATLLKGNCLTYRIPTMEFCSTFCTLKKRAGIRFRLNNQDFALTTDQLNNIFEIPLGGISKPPSGWDWDGFWASITNGEDEYFVPQHAKSSKIHNPVFRYIQKMISSSLLARQSTGNMRTEELLILWGMLSGTRIDAGTFLVDQLRKQMAPIGLSICIGGLVTRITLSLGLDLSRHVPESGDIYISRSLLVRMRMLDKRWRRLYKLLYSDGDFFPLPNKELTTVNNLDEQSNWKMSTDRHREAVQIFNNTRIQPFRRRSEDDTNEEDEEEDEGLAQDEAESSRGDGRCMALSQSDMSSIQGRFNDLDTRLGMLEKEIKSISSTVEKWRKADYDRWAADEQRRVVEEQRRVVEEKKRDKLMEMISSLYDSHLKSEHVPILSGLK